MRTIEDVIGMSVQAYVALMEHAGNSFAVFGAERCCIKSGAVYAYSPTDFGRILRENCCLLTDHGWPIVPADFIKRIASEWLDSEDPVTPVIKQGFGGLQSRER